MNIFWWTPTFGGRGNFLLRVFIFLVVASHDWLLIYSIQLCMCVERRRSSFFAFMNYFFINWSFRHRHRLMTKRVFSIHASFIHSNCWQRFCYCEWNKILQSPREIFLRVYAVKDQEAASGTFWDQMLAVLQFSFCTNIHQPFFLF